MAKKRTDSVTATLTPIDLDANLRHALFRAPGAAATWEKLQREGATDGAIEELLVDMFETIDGHIHADGFDYSCGLNPGREPMFCLGEFHSTKQLFSGVAIIAKVRDLLQIPEPKASATPTPREIDTGRINEARQRFRDATRNHIQAQAEAKRAKKEWEGAAEALARTLDEEFDPRPGLFDRPPAPQSSLNGKHVEPEDDAWKSVPLSSLGLAPSLATKLSDAGLSTIGELQEFLEPNNTGYTKRLTDIAGIGEGNAEKLQAALDQFWEERKRKIDAEIDADRDDTVSQDGEGEK